MTHTREVQADKLIEATLATLRHTPPPSGLEDHLLSALEAARQRTSESKQPRVRVPHVSNLRYGWRANALSPRVWAGTALAATILALVFAIHLHDRFTPTQTSTPTTATAGAPTIAPSPHEPVILSEAQRSRRTPRLSTHRNSPDPSTSAPGATTPTPYEQAALADALAPSQPAPPIPLTQQERLLLRCTRRGQPIEVAELDFAHEPGYQPSSAARDAVALQEHVKALLRSLVGYQQFDPVPPPDETPLPSTPPDPAQQPISSH